MSSGRGLPLGAVLGGANAPAPRSGSHYVYITLEGIKVLALVAAGIAMLTISHERLAER
jgi:hypothetical protein